MRQVDSFEYYSLLPFGRICALSATTMAKLNTLQLVLVVVANIRGAIGDMYDAYYIDHNDFLSNKTEQQMTEFMCSVYAGKNGHTAFKIDKNSGKCKLGAIKVNTTQCPTGAKTYVKSGIPVKSVQKCMISPIIVDNQMGADDIKYISERLPLHICYLD